MLYLYFSRTRYPRTNKERMGGSEEKNPNDTEKEFNNTGRLALLRRRHDA